MLELHYPIINLLGQNLSINDTSTLPDYARYFFNLGIASAGFIAACVVAFGGIYYLVSYGRGKFTSEAKEWIKAGILGLIIVMCAYLIAGTINPNLVIFGLRGLPVVSLVNPLTGEPIPPNVKITNFQEIPIGILTENLLTRTMDCYGFDPEGNPIDGEKIKTDDGREILGPTYLNHDRADCLVQLTDGAQKKALVIAELSDEINKLMSKCSCAGKCNDPCNQNNKGCDNHPPACTGACKGNNGLGAACSPLKANDSCCTPDVKNQIEHGEIEVGGNTNGSIKCDNPSKEYHGLDEFRCSNPIKEAPYTSCDNIENFVEQKVQFNKQTITIIDQKKWEKLNLVQQLNYFKEKINDLKQKIQTDVNTLNRGRTALSSCYLAIPSADLLKEFKNTDQTTNVILTKKIISDPENNNNLVDASKYCSGFNYNNSSCLKKCGDECPDTGNKAMGLYQRCGNCDSNNQTCLDQQQQCIKDAYNSRPCTNGPDTSKTFNDCISSCKDDCKSVCSQKYLDCSNEFTVCQDQCDNNSKCLLVNTGKCLLSSQKFVSCSQSADNSDPGNIQNCINNAYLCKNGSNEYAGYIDCAVSSNNNCPQDSFSASFFYDNPKCQKCPAPYGSITKNNPNSSVPPPACQDLNPETAKCPASSSCSACPCDQINQTLDFSVQNINIITEKTNNIGKEGESTIEQDVLANQIVSSQCNAYSYNEDPLTFYCKESWWTDPNREGQSTTPIGAARDCPKNLEVPVGQTVDNAEIWASNLMETATSYLSDIEKVLKDAKQISNKQPNQYCACDSKYDTGLPICTSNCRYVPPAPAGIDDNRNLAWSLPTCAFIPCRGDSCKQMMYYLSNVWNDSRQLKVDYINFYTSMLQEPRSDIIKQLTYSRQTTNQCSAIQNISKDQVRMLNCTRAEDEKIPSVINNSTTLLGQTYKHYCYGTALGKISDVSLTDNWFCCNLQNNK